MANWPHQEGYMIGFGLLAAAAAAAQPTDHATMDHAKMEMSATLDISEPKEPGQAAYAALGEVVRILLADPATNWSKVDVDGLRRHLADMDAVTLRSQVKTTRLANGACFEVTGSPEVADAIKRMVSAHFSQPDAGLGWNFTSEPRQDGATVTVTSNDNAQATKIAALGFYGILTMGDHHQPHHLMMARGGMKH
jgi:hypothetical protein